jgi:hypothetical protein
LFERSEVGAEAIQPGLVPMAVADENALGNGVAHFLELEGKG